MEATGRSDRRGNTTSADTPVDDPVAKGTDLLDEVVHAVHARHPGADPLMVRRLAELAIAKTADAPVQQFRVLLAARQVEARLREERRGGTAPGVPEGAPDGR